LYGVPSLIERRHQQIRAEIAQAAMGLFADRGFDDVTMDDVAAAAGASRRTVYRHFPTKGDLVFERPRGWVRHFDEIVVDLHVGESGLDRCFRALRSVADLIEASDEAVFVGFKIYLQTPSLRGIHARLDDEVFSRISALVAPDLPDNDDKVSDTAIIAGALVGTLNGVLAAWAMQWPDRSMTELMDHALQRLNPALTRVRGPKKTRSPRSTSAAVPQ
jgi:AcrR family transcriptional regulator